MSNIKTTFVIILIIILIIFLSWDSSIHIFGLRNNNMQQTQPIQSNQSSDLDITYYGQPDTNSNSNSNSSVECESEFANSVSETVLTELGLNNLEKFSIGGIMTTNLIESFGNIKNTSISIPMQNQISFKKIKPNKLYYGLPCSYIKDDCFYDSLKKAGYITTNDLTMASLVVPCSYETTEKEITDLELKNIKTNQFGDGVRIFMLNNTDHMVSKLALWQYLKKKYGPESASNMLPYTWDLTNNADTELFKSQYDKNKIYITKNNHQRQEGIEIHTSLDSILASKDKYLLVQELLQDPYLVSGRKINLRVYVLVIRDNYSNTKLQIYKDGFMYYTPELFEPGNPSFKKNITTGYIDRQVYVENPLTHKDFRTWLDNPKRNLSKIEQYMRTTYPHIKLSDYIFSQIYELLGFIFQTYDNVVGTKTHGVSFQLYGVDVAINQDLRPMVMEINKGPDLGAKDGRDRELKMNLSTDILKSVGLIEPNSQNDFITVLEKVNINGNLTCIHNLVDH